MMGSIFNPLLLLIIILFPFMLITAPLAKEYGTIWPGPSESDYFEYDNVDDDIFELKYNISSKFFIFKATHADIPSNQWQDMIFTDEEGYVITHYLSYDLEEESVRYGNYGAKGNIYGNPYICKTDYPDKTGYWEPDTDENNWFLYLPIEKRTGDEVEFTILCRGTVKSRQTFFTYYIIDENGEPQPVDRIYVTYSYDIVTSAITVENEFHSLD